PHGPRWAYHPAADRAGWGSSRGPASAIPTATVHCAIASSFSLVLPVSEHAPQQAVHDQYGTDRGTIRSDGWQGGGEEQTAADHHVEHRHRQRVPLHGRAAITSG